MKFEMSELKLERLYESKREFVLTEEFTCQIGQLLIRIPEGFVTDFASIPTFLWPLLPPYGKYDIPALVHDYFYSELNTTGINRKLADKIFLELMKEFDVDCLTRHIIYLGVRQGGSLFFKKKKINGLESFDDETLINKTKEAKEYYQYYKNYLGF